MSTRTDWGWFDKDGKPLAVGDLHSKWRCPLQKWDFDIFYEHPYTGELIHEEPQRIPCPVVSVDVKLGVCEQCGNQFRYP